jgi:thioredoxin reductase (NADPH)
MSANNLLSVAFPTLDETQIRQLAGCTRAQPKLFQDGQTLFAVGERNMNFFVVKSGEAEIVDYSGDERKTIAVHRPGEFTGDISHLTGCPPSSAALRGATARCTKSPETPCGRFSISAPLSAISFSRPSSRDGSFCANLPTSPAYE